jgi:alkylation response protein AidB-like acyl-CoA dehydrogenase
VYFTDVRIPDSQRLGAVGQGWQVSLTTLMNERLHRRRGGAASASRRCSSWRRRSRSTTAGHREPAVREKLADWYCHGGLKYTAYRTLTALSRGETPGPRELHRQAGGRAQDPGHGVVRHRPAGAVAGVIWDPSSRRDAAPVPEAY